MPPRNRVFKNLSRTLSYDWSVSPGIDGQPPANSGSGETLTYVNKESMSDFVTPGFKKISASGGVVNNPMTKSLTISTPGTGTRTATSKWNGHKNIGSNDVVGYFCSYDGISHLSAPASLTSTLEAKRSNAYLQCLSQIDSTPFSFGEDLAEFHKTIGTLRRPLSLANDLALVYKRKKDHFLSSGLTHAQALSKAWLSVRYQYRPIIMSIMNALESHKSSETQPVRQTARSSYSSRASLSSTQTSGTRSYSKSGSWSIEGRYGILYEVTNPRSDFAWKNGLRLKDVPPTIWAIMPYSWVIDRFYNVSSFIKANVNRVDPSVKVLAAWHTVTETSDTSVSYVSDNDPNYTVVISADPWQIRRETKTRSPIGANVVWDVPTPSYDGSIWSSATQVADLLALIIGRLK